MLFCLQIKKNIKNAKKMLTVGWRFGIFDMHFRKKDIFLEVVAVQVLNNFKKIKIWY